MPRSEAMKKAQLKYYQKIINNPDLKKVYYEKNKKYIDNYRNKNKDNEDYKLKKRESAKKYYYLHQDEIKEKNKLYYQNKKLKQSLQITTT